MYRSNETSKIHDVEMKHYDLSTTCLGTSGVCSCICFVVILNNGKKVFIEHRADDYFPKEFTMENVRLVLQNMVEHITLNSSEDKITSVLILGGLDNEEHRFESLRNCISKLSQDDYDDELQNYNDLLKNIKWLNTTFNFEADDPQETGECSIDAIIIDKLKYTNEQRLVLIQRVKKINGWNIINAVMVFHLQSGHAQFAVTPTVTGPSSELVTLCSKSIDKFRVNAHAINAVEVDGLLREELFNYSSSAFDRLQTKLRNTEKKLDEDDIEMCDL